MVETIRGYTVKKARKPHPCNAWNVYLEHFEHELFGYKCAGINIGDSYEGQFNRDCGDVWDFKTCQKCKKIAEEHEIPLYEE